jgi:enamine deaminase RidA (YjgF/YER057c/UK114 family)
MLASTPLGTTSVQLRSGNSVDFSCKRQVFEVAPLLIGSHRLFALRQSKLPTRLPERWRLGPGYGFLQDCSLLGRLAGRFILRLRMDQTTQVNIPAPQSPKTNFKGAFDEVAYSFEKIVGEVRGDSNLVVAKQAVNQLQISLNQFENLLKERGSTVDSYDSIKYLYQEIEHPLTELRRYFMKEPSEILTDKAGVVYVNALKASFRKLIDIADGMDECSSSIPKST